MYLWVNSCQLFDYAGLQKLSKIIHTMKVKKSDKEEPWTRFPLVEGMAPLPHSMIFLKPPNQNQSRYGVPSN